MTRLFGAYVYSDAPRQSCWWAETCTIAPSPPLDSDTHCDVAIIGGGYTGLNAALTLAQNGVDVAVFDEKAVGWGASGRNGGFCCLGGTKLDDGKLDTRFGRDARIGWRQTERAAVTHVAHLLRDHQIDADVHSKGETLLAHRAKDMRWIEEEAQASRDNYGVDAQLHSKSDLEDLGMKAGFFGGSTVPCGFALNPQKYAAGIQRIAASLGVRIYERACVGAMQRGSSHWTLQVEQHKVRAQSVLIATNGYSSEHLPPWLGGRYLPVQSNIAVTRPLRDTELARQGWTSDQMCYDSRNLLHYFRLMPDRRMLFGMRGGLGGTPASGIRAQRRLHRDFRNMFPEWWDVPLTHHWSGMVCLSANLAPIVGAVPGAPDMFISLAYHGNGVAMGSYCGTLIAQQILGASQDALPIVLQSQTNKFPLGGSRRVFMPFVYAAQSMKDR